MAIDLPPIIPPQASTAAKIENYAAISSAGVIEREVAGYTLRISGNKYLSETQIDTIMAAVQTPAQAVNGLNQAYYQLGHLLVTIYYAHQGNVIYAHVINGKLSQIKAPEAIANYFDELIGDEHLTRAEFDEKRVLADIKSQRAGVEYAISYQLESDPQAFTMVFTESDIADHDATKVSLGANNLGNRYLGRYFTSAGLKHDFSNGVEFNFSYDRAMTQWGETKGGDYYNSYSLKLDTPSPWGLYGIEGRYFEYARDVGLVFTIPDDNGNPAPGNTQQEQCLAGLNLVCDLLNGLLTGLLPGDEGPNDDGTVDTQVIFAGLESESTSIAVTGEQIISSDSFRRLSFSQRLEHIENTIDLEGFGRLLDEPQTTLELGLKYNRIMRLFSIPTQIVVQGFVETGLGSDSGTLGSSDEVGSVGIGRRSGEFVVLKPRFSAKLNVMDWASLNIQFISQFSNDTQLPQQQQFVLGGSSLSAYLPGILVGDSGTFTKLSFVGNGLPAFGLTFTPAVFFEHGQAWYEDAQGPVGSTRQVSDAGLSLSLSWRDVIKTDIVAAVPVSDDNVEKSLLDQAEVDFFWNLRVMF